MIPRAYRPLGSAAVSVPAVAGPVTRHDADLEAALTRFERYLVAVHRAANTRRLYLTAVRRWLHAGGAPGHFDENLFWNFVGARRRALGAEALRMEVKALRAFYAAMHSLGVTVAGVAVPRVPTARATPRRMVRWLDVDQVAAVVLAPDVATWSGFRDHVILRVLAETGIRAGELVALELGDVLEGWLFVRAGKSARDRYVPLLPDLEATLRRWIGRRGEARPGKRGALFLTRHGHGFRGTWSVWDLVARHTRAALGIACGPFKARELKHSTLRPWSGFYPHLLRASLATALLQRGMPITAIAETLGHESVETTTHYLGADVEHLRRELAKHPRHAARSTSNSDD